MSKVVSQQLHCGRLAPIAPVLDTHNDGNVRCFRHKNGRPLDGGGHGKRCASLSRSLHSGGMIDANMGDGVAMALRHAINMAKK